MWATFSKKNYQDLSKLAQFGHTVCSKSLDSIRPLVRCFVYQDCVCGWDWVWTGALLKAAKLQADSTDLTREKFTNDPITTDIHT